MTAFDVTVIAIFLASLALGSWRGVIGEIVALTAWIVAFFCAKWWGDTVAQFCFSGLIADHGLRLIVAWIAIFIVILFLLALVRLAIRNLLSALGLSPTDRALGFIFGAARGLLIVVLLIAVGGMTELPKEAWWRNAYLAAPLETLVLASKPCLPLEMSKRIHYR